MYFSSCGFTQRRFRIERITHAAKDVVLWGKFRIRAKDGPRVTFQNAFWRIPCTHSEVERCSLWKCHLSTLARVRASSSPQTNRRSHWIPDTISSCIRGRRTLAFFLTYLRVTNASHALRGLRGRPRKGGREMRSSSTWLPVFPSYADLRFSYTPFHVKFVRSERYDCVESIKQLQK